MRFFIDFLPWIGLVGGIAALLAKTAGERQPLTWRPLVVPLGVALVAAVGATQFQGDLRYALFWLSGSAVFGTLLAEAVSALRTSAAGQLLAALGVSVFLTSNKIEAIELSTVARFAGLVMGFAVASLPTLSREGNRIAPLLAAIVFSAGGASLLSRIGYGEQVRLAAPLIAFAMALAVAVSLTAGRALAGRAKPFGVVLAVLVFAGLSWLSLSSYLGEGDLALVSTVAIVAMLVTAWAVPVDRQSVATWGIAAVVWLGTATYAFSTAFGLGMAVAGLSGVLVALLLGRRDLLPPVGLVVGLAVYRLFRENNDEVVQAFDIGQHYAMVGFLIGTIVLVALADSLVRRRGNWQGGVSAVLVGVISAGIVVGAATFFGPKGAIGIFIGLAVAPIVSQLTASRASWTLVAAAALQCAVLVTYRPLVWEMELDRDAKVRLLGWLFAGILIVYGLLWATTRQKREEAIDVR